MYFKCKPEIVAGKIKVAQSMFSMGSIIIKKIVMSELSWIAMFGDDPDTKVTKDMKICGVTVELNDDAGKYAVIYLGTNAPSKKKAKK
jgi:biotin-(acetyl-CoA carboxylase) ligase